MDSTKVEGVKQRLYGCAEQAPDGSLFHMAIGVIEDLEAEIDYRKQEIYRLEKDIEAWERRHQSC